MKSTKSIKKIARKPFNNKLSLVVTILAFGLIGSYLLYLSLAASNYVTVQAEDGVKSGKYIEFNDGTNKGVEFGVNLISTTYNSTNNGSVTYSGTWSPSTGTGKYQNDDFFSQTTGSTATISFTGQVIEIYGAKASHHGIAGVKIDSGAEIPIDLFDVNRLENTLIYNSPRLPEGPHTLTFRVTGQQNAASTGTVISLDSYIVKSSTAPPPPPCPTGATGTYPSCVCPAGQTWVQPNCVPNPPTGGDPVNNTNGLRVGYLYTDFSYDRPGRATSTAITAIDNLLRQEPWLLATHTYGFGVWSVAPGNWTDLDARINRIRGVNGIPILVLCCAPPAYSNDASNIESKPKPEFFDDLARDYATIAQRYTDVKYFVVWNEMKGFWNNTANRWDYEGYTVFYNHVYNAIKAVRPDAMIGGPYPPLTNWKAPVPGGAQSTVNGVWGTRDQRGLDVIQYWLDHKVGGQFVTMDGGCDLHSQQGGGYPAGVTAIQANECFKATAAWVRARSPLPIWWIEFYANPVPIGTEAYKRDVFIDAFNKYKAGGGNVALFWGSECYGGTLSYQFGSMWDCTNGGTFPLFDAVKNGYN